MPIRLVYGDRHFSSTEGEVSVSLPGEGTGQQIWVKTEVGLVNQTINCTPPCEVFCASQFERKL